MRIPALVLAMFLVAATTAAHTAPVCDAPPYGAPQVDYRSFMETFGKALSNPRKVLAAVCRAKFDPGSQQHQTLNQLGIDDQAIAGKSVVALAIAMLDALRAKTQPNESEPAQPTYARIYAAFTCFTASNQCQLTFDGSPLTGARTKPFVSRKECQDYVRSIYGVFPDSNGRMPLSSGMWLECRSRVVENDGWQ